ncbi:MAG: septum formation initiator family protein [Chitinophagales bacterium]|nr:septum formation initiator family protein [Chitinophagales bacterium]MDW8394324.1 septum formation initiator family protein [Chitinophagales bacterium]
MRIKRLPSLPSWLRNRYVLVLLAFLIWMLFLDRNNLLSQFRLYNKLRSYEQKQAYYEKEIEHLKTQKEALMTQPGKLEQVAREHFMMKRENEDLYLIRKEER